MTQVLIAEENLASEAEVVILVRSAATAAEAATTAAVLQAVSMAAAVGVRPSFRATPNVTRFQETQLPTR